MVRRGMTLSTGTRRLLSEAASWTAVAVTIAIIAAHYSELRDFAARAVELPASSTAIASTNATNIGSAGRVELRADAQGHYNSDIEINGRSVHAMVDTGATMVALSFEDAERSGIFLSRSDFNHPVRTANGLARVAPVILHRVRIGDIEVRDVPAAVAEPGRLQGTLLGMSFLGRLSRLEMQSGRLVLHD